MKTDKERLDQLAAIVRQKRRDMGVKQKEFAKVIGCSYATISHIECAKGSPKFDLFMRICDVLDLDPREFLTKSEALPTGITK